MITLLWCGSREYDRGLVYLAFVGAYLGSEERVGENKEAGEVALVGFDAPLRDVEPIELCGIFTAHGRMSEQIVFGNLLLRFLRYQTSQSSSCWGDAVETAHTVAMPWGES